MLIELPYDRTAAVNYSNFWALKRNPRYLNFHGIGGDCSNFVSQCIYAGTGVMNYTPDLGWYYINQYKRAAAWTSVRYLYKFLINNKGVGPFATDVVIDKILPGDVIQLGKENGEFYHTLLIASVGSKPATSNILVNAHNIDSYLRPLDTYNFYKIRFLHIEGYRKS